jgi:hypothetical protein
MCTHYLHCIHPPIPFSHHLSFPLMSPLSPEPVLPS